MYNVPNIQQMPDSKHKSPPLPVNDKKMPDDNQMPANNRKRKITCLKIEGEFI